MEVVSFQHRTGIFGAVKHSGDNRTGGDGPGDDEAITVDFTRMPAEADQIVFTVNCFTGATFDEVENAYRRLVDESTGVELARCALSGGGRHTAQIMAKTSCPPSTATSDPVRPGPPVGGVVPAGRRGCRRSLPDGPLPCSPGRFLV